MKNNTNKCPYLAHRNNQCTHKENNYGLPKTGAKCPYNKADKCPLYQEWEEYRQIRESALRSAYKPPQEVSE